MLIIEELENLAKQVILLCTLDNDVDNTRAMYIENSIYYREYVASKYLLFTNKEEYIYRFICVTLKPTEFNLFQLKSIKIILKRKYNETTE
tara:strand:+ start:23872 stop:24144 length:273 start_codon:yes stop_codon:yes gene_type:complete